MTVPAWVADAVFYQVFPDRFARSDRVPKPSNLEDWDAPPTVHGYKGGDLVGVVEHLDHIQDLGATALYLNPVFASGSNHRYHTYDYFAVDPMLGGNGALDELIEAVHARGMRIVLDAVLNHASRGFFQFHDLMENGAQSAYTDWFTVHDWPVRAYGVEHNYEAWHDLPALPKFNTDTPAVREFLMTVGEHWARRGIDGWRLDVPDEITTPGFWEEFRQRVRAINPDLYIVGELWRDASAWVNDGTRFDGTMNYLLAEAVLPFVGDIDHDSLGIVDYDVRTPVSAEEFVKRVERMHALYTEEALRGHMTLLASHDTPRLLTVLSGDRHAAILAITLLLTHPGAPSVYYGDEVGMTGPMDPGCRGGFPWSGAHDAELLTAHRELIALRHAHPALRSTQWDARTIGSSAVWVDRRAGDEHLAVVVNSGDDPIDLDVGRAQVIWGQAAPGGDGLTIPARSAAILRPS